MIRWNYLNKELQKIVKDIPIKFEPDDITLNVRNGPCYAPRKTGIQIYPKEGKINDVEHTSKRSGFHHANEKRCYFWLKGVKCEIFYETQH